MSMLRQLSSFALAAILGVLPLLAASVWEKKRFRDWSEEDVIRLLTDSPWGRTETKTIDFDRAGPPKRPVTWRELGIEGSGPQSAYGQDGSPVGGIGKPKSKNLINVNINVRWSSALPVRQAVALSKYGREGLDKPEARKVLEGGAFYVIDVSGVPAALAFHGLEALQDDLFRKVRLVTGSGRAIKPESVYVTSRGKGVGITFRFPKTEPLTLKDKQAELTMNFGKEKVSRKFKFKQMVYQGELAL